MIPIACAVLHNFIKQEKVDDTFDNIDKEVPNIGKGSSSRRGACPRREGDSDVPEHSVAQFSQKDRSYMVRV